MSISGQPLFEGDVGRRNRKHLFKLQIYQHQKYQHNDEIPECYVPASKQEIYQKLTCYDFKNIATNFNLVTNEIIKEKRFNKMKLFELFDLKKYDFIFVDGVCDKKTITQQLRTPLVSAKDVAEQNKKKDLYTDKRIKNVQNKPCGSPECTQKHVWDRDHIVELQQLSHNIELVREEQKVRQTDKRLTFGKIW